MIIVPQGFIQTEGSNVKGSRLSISKYFRQSILLIQSNTQQFFRVHTSYTKQYVVFGGDGYLFY